MAEYNGDPQKVVEYVVDAYERWKEQRLSKEAVWQECLYNYLCWVDPAKYQGWPWRSKVCDTMSQEIADAIGSALVTQMLPLDEDYFSIQHLSPGGEAYREIVKEELKRRLVQANFSERLLPVASQLAVLGNTAFTMPWRRKTRMRRMRRGRNIERVEEVKYDNFAFEPLDVLDVVVDPHAVVSPSSMMIWRVQTSLDELKQHKELYKNLDQLEATIGLPDDRSRSDKVSRAAIFGFEYKPEDQFDIELLVCYGDIVIDGEMHQDSLAVIGNRGVCLRFEENPYFGGRPCFLGTYSSLWFTPYGRGPLEALRGQQALINTFLNQKADILNLIIMGAFAYVDDGTIEPSDLVLEPGKGIPVGDINNIKPLTPPGNPALAYQEIAMLRDRGDQSSGASDYMRGVFPGGRKTAYETQQIVAGSSARLNATLRHLGESMIEPALNFALESIQQFTYGRNPEIPDEALEERYYAQYTGAQTAILREEQKQALREFLAVMAQDPEMSAALNRREVAEEVRRLSRITNRRLILTEEQMKAKQAMDMALAEAQRFMNAPAANPMAEAQNA